MHYQSLREAHENKVRENIARWAMSSTGPSEMTIGQLRELADIIVDIVNSATLKAWELGKNARCTE